MEIGGKNCCSFSDNEATSIPCYGQLIIHGETDKNYLTKLQQESLRRIHNTVPYWSQESEQENDSTPKLDSRSLWCFLVDTYIKKTNRKFVFTETLIHTQ